MIRLRTERLHEIIKVFAIGELVTLSKKFAGHDEQVLAMTRGERKELADVRSMQAGTLDATS